jgi:hypothetical protein
MNKVSERETWSGELLNIWAWNIITFAHQAGWGLQQRALSANWRRHIKNNLLITNARQLRPQRALAGVGNNLLPRFISHPRRAPRCKFGQGGARGARARERHIYLDFVNAKHGSDFLISSFTKFFQKCELRLLLSLAPNLDGKNNDFSSDARVPWEIFIKREKEHEKRARPLGESEKAHKENQQLRFSLPRSSSF